MNRVTFSILLAALVLCTALLLYMRKDDIKPTLGVSAILVAERCGRVWVIHEDGRADFRIVHVPTASEAELEACADAGPRETIEMCGRRWMVTPTAPGRAMATRMEHPYEEEGCL